MNQEALYKISYGLYIVAANCNGEESGCIVNTVQQVTSEPIQISTIINKDNYTCELIKKSGKFSVSVLSREASFELIGRFGFRTGKDFKKFEGASFERTKDGLPYLTETTSAWFTCGVKQMIDFATHICFVGTVKDSDKLSDLPSMTYEYYRSVIKGATPARAPSFQKTDK